VVSSQVSQMLSEQYNPDLDLLSQPCMCSPGLQYSVFNVQCSVFTSVFSV